MLFIHPIMQLIAILFALYALRLGSQRFRTLHLHHRAAFKWKRHVIVGLTTLSGLLVGMCVGIYMVYTHWHSFLMTGTHGYVAAVMLPLIFFGIGSGLLMNAKKKKRMLLPLFHGINNALIVVLALSQVITGWRILSMFVLGL